MMSDATFQKELKTLINRYSLENGSNTPDFLLAMYLVKCLDVYDEMVNARETWYGRRNLGSGGTGDAPKTPRTIL